MEQRFLAIQVGFLLESSRLQTRAAYASMAVKRELARQITGERASVNREVTLEALRTANIPLLEQYWLHIDEFENRKIGLNA